MNLFRNRILVITLLLVGFVVVSQIYIARQNFHDASFGIEFLPLIPATFLLLWFFGDFFIKDRLKSFCVALLIYMAIGGIILLFIGTDLLGLLGFWPILLGVYIFW